MRKNIRPTQIEERFATHLTVSLQTEGKRRLRGYRPSEKPEAARGRRHGVLRRMLEPTDPRRETDGFK